MQDCAVASPQVDKNGFMHICVMIPYKFKVPPLATSGSE